MTDPSCPANTLIQGPKEKIDAYVARLTPSCPIPVVTLTKPTESLTAIAGGSVIVHNVARYTLEQQQELLAWLDGSGSGVRLISTSAERLYDLVESGQFLEVLYYRLNVILIDFGSQLFLVVVAALFGR